MEYAYYGRMDSIVVREGVHYLMIDETLNKIMNIAKHNFEFDLKKWMNDYKKECKKSVVTLESELKSLKREVNILMHEMKTRTDEEKKKLAIKKKQEKEFQELIKKEEQIQKKIKKDKK